MPTTENDRRNLQQPVLEKPSLPDHDRTRDAGMHAARPDQTESILELIEERDESELVSPDQEFGEILKSGGRASNGRFPTDPNNVLTSDPDPTSDGDPESRGDSLPDILERDQH